MRINVYHEELTNETEIVRVEPHPGRRFIGVRTFLKSPDALHHRPNDDDRSAVTTWLGTHDEAIDYYRRIIFALQADRTEKGNIG